MNVLVINTNRCTQPYVVFPLGACLVADAARRAGHHVEFLDLAFERRPLEAIARRLANWRGDVVGISIRNIDNNDVQNTLALADDAAACVSAVRRGTSAKIVIGGAAVGVMPKQFLRHTGADFAAAGDGEHVFVKLLEALDAGRDPSGLEGVVAPGSDDFVRPTRLAMTRGTAEDFSRWLRVGDYLKSLSAAPLQTKRGCPFHCTYCTYNIMEGYSYRLLEPPAVVDEVRRLCGQGLSNIEIVDNVFNSPHEHAMAICEALAEARTGARLQSIELNPQFVDDALLGAMERAGFVGMGITAESAADAALAGLGKGYGAEAVHKAADAVRRHNIPCIWLFMVGGPGETPETVEQTIDFACRHIRPRDVAFFTLAVRIYPGTPLEATARSQGLLTAPAEEMLRPMFYVSPEISLPDVTARLNALAREHMNFLVGDAISLPLMQSLLRVAYWLGMRSPLYPRTVPVRKVLQFLHLYP